MSIRTSLFTLFLALQLVLLYLSEGFPWRESGQMMLFAGVLGLLVNSIKSYIPGLHKITVILGSFFVVLFSLPLVSGSTLAPLLFLLPLTLATLGYGIYGGVGVYVLSALVLYQQLNSRGASEKELLVELLSLGLSLAGLLYLSNIHQQMVKNNEDWLSKLHAKINEMTLLREVTTAMQSAKDLKKLDKIVLTAITAGYGLGFNRALLFLVEDDRLIGEYAIGPSSRKEAYRIWGDVVIKQSSLHEVLDSAEEKDETLLDIIERVELPMDMDSTNPLIQCIYEKTPRLLHGASPEAFGETLAPLSFEHCAVVPMISKDQAVGVFLVDNRYNEKPILDADLDALITFSGQSALAFENIRLYEKIRVLAITDELTGVYNHRHYKDTVQRYLTMDIPFVLLVIDVDDFKMFNERYGHAVGDQVLKEVGASLKKAVKYKGEAFRYGGDEFTLILPQRTREEALEVASSIQRSILDIALHQVDSPLTLSIGLAEYPLDTLCEKDLFILADRNLKSAKESGKNAVHWEVESC